MVDAIEKQVKDCQWIGGQQPSTADREAFEGLNGAIPNVASHPHAFAWYCLVARFSTEVRQSWVGAAAPAKGGKADKPAKGGDNKKGGKGGKDAKPAKKDDDDFDPFADDDEEDAAAAAALKAKAAAAKNAKPKKVVVAKSIIVWDVKPFSSETDLDFLAKKILAITQDGLAWKTEYKKEPVAFGVFKLQIGAVVEDEKVSTDLIAEQIEELTDESAVDKDDNEDGYLVQSTEIVCFNNL